MASPPFAQLRDELREGRLEHVVVETESKSPREVAEEILRQWAPFGHD